MNIILKIIAAVLLPFGCLAGEGYIIKGKIAGIQSGYAAIHEGGRPWQPGGTYPRVRIENGAFTLTGKVAHPAILLLKISTKTFQIILENTEYSIACDFKELAPQQLKGSTLNDQFRECIGSGTNQLGYAAQHADQPVAPILVHFYAREYSEIKKGYDALSQANKDSWHGRALAEKLAVFHSTQAGSIMPDFNMTSPEGKNFSVRNMAGKIVVLDFWASWCGPCRSYVPAMRELYQQYQPKGVEFVAASFDEEEEKWRTAIRETGMEWTQGLIHGGFSAGSPVKKMLHITSIPHVIVVGKDGKIAAWLDAFAKQQLPDILAKLTQ
ncbi:TlpA disulfide reductase family protein [Chitinophaga solisilvae]|uniref:TlpA disulfide reductase family protein n=1 Tax=Chitinophaga solisilvae TaxID=1233460 RepID=UPI0013688DC0|nr:TlpA disulfide reductase family protein [Chitinophaga solisilvae]